MRKMNDEDLTHVEFMLRNLRRTMTSTVSWWEVRVDHQYFFDNMTKRIDKILSLFNENGEINAPLP